MFEVPPFPALLCLLSEPLLALLILHGDKVPVVINQNILGGKKIKQKISVSQTNQAKNRPASEQTGI